MISVAPRLSVAAPTDAVNSVLTLKAGAVLADTGNTVVASDGSGPYTYTMTSGSLPDGLTFTNGKFTGTPAADSVGQYKITVGVTDSSLHQLSGSVSFTINIGAGLFVTSTLKTTGAIGDTWTGTLAVTGEPTGITYSIPGDPTCATLPGGLTLNPNTGAITGTATTANAPDGVTIVFQAQDAAGVTGTITVKITITTT
jgi:hypothetical protein